MTLPQTFIIAEAGVNHNGNMDLAKKLIEKAAEAGADAVKFQTFKAEKIVARNADKAAYQKQSTGNNESQFEMLQRLELDEAQFKELAVFCRQSDITFLSTPFDLDSVDMLAAMGMPVFKIPSGEITNLPLLRKVGSLRKKIILSTGMASLQEINEALKVFIKAGSLIEDITVLHCSTQYPTPASDVNLKAMQTIAAACKVAVGYSDHTLGTEVAIAATALGAQVIEKHFTIDRSLPGPDHQASLTPQELRDMVFAIRNIEKALGNGIKEPTPAELDNLRVVRRSIVASTSISKGEKFSPDNLTVKRPATGLSPMQWDAVIGQEALRNFEPDEPIEIETVSSDA